MVEVLHHRFTVEAYEEMVAHGILTEDDRVELLAGEIVEMSPIGDPHVGCVNRLTALFSAALMGHAVVQIQNPVVLPPDSVPEPDVAILRPRADFYGKGKARPGDIFFLVEVAQSSLRFDRLVKVPIYAKRGVPEVWIADVLHGTIDCYREPFGDTYASVRILRDNDEIAPLAFPGARFRVSDIVPVK